MDYGVGCKGVSGWDVRANFHVRPSSTALRVRLWIKVSGTYVCAGVNSFVAGA